VEIFLANPRGFCAGVDRAIEIVNQAIKKFGAPIYVRHEVVHNRTVVAELKTKGAIFVDEVEDVPSGAIIIFSAHGVSKAVRKEAEEKDLTIFDATCPLVTKVHNEVKRFSKEKRETILIGHAGHPEVIGTMGQLPLGEVILVETCDDARELQVEDADNLAFVTQTTLSVDDTKEIVDILQARFPQITSPHKEDICYATTNRQAAVKAMAAKCDLVLVIGATSSSNSMRLVEVAKKSGAKNARLIESKSDVNWTELQGVKTLGITAGASAPENLITELLDAIAKRTSIHIETLETATENISFKLPKILQS